MNRLRAATLLSGFLVLTLPLMPFQAAFLYVWPDAARRFPHWYHRQVCRLIGVRILVEGAVERNHPVLLISNHTSWLDIPVLSAVAPVSFVSKKEVGSWPFVSWLAKLQRSVFVDRRRRSATPVAASEIAARLAQGDTIVLFAEGTSSDGNRVLPFLSALFGAVLQGERSGSADVPEDLVVQTSAIVYTHHHGVPLSRDQRPLVGWYGDMEMIGHAWQLLGAGPLDVTIRISEPIPVSQFASRKDLAAASESQVRRDVVRILRGRGSSDPINLAEVRHKVPRTAVSPSLSTQHWR